MLRRTFITGLASVALIPPAGARDIGVRGVHELLEVLPTMHAITMGSGPIVHTLVTPRCAKASDMWAGAVTASSSVTIRWIPVGSGYGSDTDTVARCLAVGTPEAVLQLLEGEVTGEATADAAWKANDQGRIYGARVERLLWESTGRTPAAPTMVFRDRSGNARIIRGALPVERFAEVLAAVGV